MSKFILIGITSGKGNQPCVAQAVYSTNDQTTEIPEYALKNLNLTLKRVLSLEITQSGGDMWDGPIITHDPETKS